MSGMNEHIIDTSTFPCLKYLLAKTADQKDLYFFARILFNACEKMKVEPTRAMLLYKSYKFNAPAGLDFNEYRGENIPGSEYRECILADDSILSKPKCRDNLLDRCPEVIMPEEKKKRDPDVCCLCPISPSFKNRDKKKEYHIFRYMLSGPKQFKEVASWLVVPYSDFLMFRSVWDLTVELDAETPIIVPLISVCAQQFMQLGADVFISKSNDDPTPIHVLFGKVVEGVADILIKKYPYVSLIDRLGDGVLNSAIENAVKQLGREIDKTELLSEEDCRKEMESISEKRDKKKKKKEQVQPVSLFDILDNVSVPAEPEEAEQKASLEDVRDSAPKEENEDGQQKEPLEEPDFEPEFDPEAQLAEPAEQTETVEQTESAELAENNPPSGEELAVPAEQNEVMQTYSMHVPVDSGLFLPDMEYIAPYDADGSPEMLCSLIEQSKVCPVEIALMDNGPAYLFYLKDGSFWISKPSEMPDMIKAVLSAPSITKICWQPYLLYSVSRNSGIMIKNIYSIYSMAGNTKYGVFERKAELERCNALMSQSKGRELPFSDTAFGFDKYIIAWAVQQKEISVKESVVKATELWDMVLGCSYDLGFSAESAGNPMRLTADGNIIYNHATDEGVMPFGTVLLTVSLQGIKTEEALPILMKALLYLAGKRYFFKVPISLYGLNDMSGVVELLCDTKHVNLMQDELQSYLHRYLIEHKYASVSVVFHKGYSLKDAVSSVDRQLTDMKSMLLQLTTADSELVIDSSRINVKYSRKPTRERNTEGAFT